MERYRSSTVRRTLARLSAFAVGLLCLVGVWAGFAPHAWAAQTIFYVSPSGSGTACSQAAPCRLDTGKAQVAQNTANMSQDLVVELMAGTYRRTTAFQLGAADSGQNGHSVIYRAAPGAKVTLSGGASVTGWSMHDSSKNIWRASLPADVANTRQLWVNGQRANIASAAAGTVFGTMTNTSTGFSYTASGPSWPDIDSVDVAYDSSSALAHPGWQQAICPVSSISNGSAVLKNPCYGNATNPRTQKPLDVRVPSTVENSRALLSSPGQFSVDKSTRTLYYIPRAGQSMSSATAIVGGTPILVDLDGTTSNPVHHIRFTGLRFEHTTWLLSDEGMLNQQANYLHHGTTVTNPWPMSASVMCRPCKNVTFSNNTFEHLGGGGIGFHRGGADNTITRNAITDVAGNGIQIGEYGTIGAPDNSAPPAQLDDGYSVTNNYLHDIAHQYLGGVGILATWVKNTTIAHNEVGNTSYSGISLGWGWGLQPQAVQANNHVDYNYVHDTMTARMHDGGGIYVNGKHATSPGSTVSNNYITQTNQGYGTLYLEAGITDTHVTKNVIGDYSTHWLFVSPANGTTRNLVDDNYVGSAVEGQYLGTPVGNTVTNNHLGLSSWPQAAQDIIAKAGFEPGAQPGAIGTDLGPARTNVAYRKPATSSTEWSSNNGPSKANQGKLDIPFSSSNSDPSAWWQTDLGAPHTLSSVQILFRLGGGDYPTERQNLEIRVSNNADMSGHTVACVIKGTLPFETRYDCPGPSDQWRYVRVAKTDGKTLALGQVRVIGTPDTNIAQGRSARASSLWSAAYPASNAVDGNTGTIFASAWQPNQWWQVDLPRQYTLSRAQIVFRNDGWDIPTERMNFQIWVSNNKNMSLGKTVACTVGTSSPALAMASTYSCALPSGTWQYLAVVKTDSNELVLAEVRAYGR